MRMRSFFPIACLGLALAACPKKKKVTQAPADAMMVDAMATDPDAALVDKVRQAATQRLAPAAVESFVGQPAWINTSRGDNDRNALEGADIAIDATMPGEATTIAGKDVAYWGRPVTSPNPKLVGIVWQADGSAKMFFGTLYPP